MFTYSRQVHVYETDLMGIVHHSNYLRFCEEARVEWFRQKGYKLSKEDIFGLVVLETQVKHLYPFRYGDTVSIQLQFKVEGVRLFIQYQLRANETLIAKAQTVHCRIDQNFKVLRLEDKLLKLVENEKWTEILP